MATAASRAPTPPSSSACPGSHVPISSRYGRSRIPSGRGTLDSPSSSQHCSSCLWPKWETRSHRTVSNVKAEENAEKLCESVAASLEGKKLGSFTRISSTVQTAMEETLTVLKATLWRKAF